MKRLPILLLALAALSSAGQSSGARAIIERQVAAYCKAMQAKDIKGVKAVMAPDFVAINRDGQKADFERASTSLAGLFKQAKSLKITCTITSFEMQKSRVHLVSHNIMDVVIQGPNGKPATLHSDSTSDEIWAPMNGTYKIKSSKELSAKNTLDGKPVRGE